MYVFLCPNVCYGFSACFIITIGPSYLVSEVVTKYWLQVRQLKEVRM